MRKALLTIIKNARGPLSKSITFENGKLKKVAAANLVSGLATRRAVETLEDFNGILEGLGSNQALTYGVCQFPKARVVTQEVIASGQAVANAVARDRAHFVWPKGRAIMFFDLDRPKDGSEPFTAPKFDALMCRLHPWWSQTARMYRPSASSYIYDAETGEELIGGGSLRVYVFVDRGENIPAVGVAVADAFWRNDFGRIEFGVDGQMLVRCPVDCAIWQPERLDFAGPVVLGKGLLKRRYRPWILSGDDIDSEAVIAAGPGYLEYRVWLSNSLEVREAKLVHRPEEKRRKRQTIEQRADEEAAKGIDREKARRKHARALLSGALSGGYVLHFTDGVATVQDVLSDPERYDQRRLADPIEPDYAGDPRIAIFFANDGHGRPCVWSHAHGGRLFLLEAA